MDSCSTSGMSHNVSLSTCYLVHYGNILEIHSAVLISRGEQQRAGNSKTVLKKMKFDSLCIKENVRESRKNTTSPLNT